MTPSPTVKLSSGYEMPLLGLGTWQSKPGEVSKAVETALNLGYRHLDCAFAYQNQVEIGNVLKKIFNEGKIKREEVFITSKVWNTFHSYGKATENIDTILKDLQLEYIDLLLIHWPTGYEEGAEIFPLTADGKKMRYSNEDYLDTWKALEDAQKAGKVRSIGISNFNHKQIERLWAAANIKPAVLQVELNPYFTQKKLRDFCAAKNIAVTAYSPLGNPGSSFFRKDGDPNILQNSLILDIGQKYGKTAAQVILRWFIETNIIVIPKSVSENRLKENFEIFDFTLTKEEVEAIEGLNKNWRLVDTSFRDNDHPHFPFIEEF